MQAKVFFFFNDTATTEIYTLSLHDALPISVGTVANNLSTLDGGNANLASVTGIGTRGNTSGDVTVSAGGARTGARLNTRQEPITNAVFCFKKKLNSTGAATSTSPATTTATA